jgi:hypothetical protein
MLVLGPERDGIGVVRLARADPEEREPGRVADPVDRLADRDGLGALFLGCPSGVRVCDVDDDGDPVSLGDALAEAS